MSGSHLGLVIDPTLEMTLMDAVAIHVALQCLLGVSADVLTSRALADAFCGRVLFAALPLWPKYF